MYSRDSHTDISELLRKFAAILRAQQGAPIGPPSPPTPEITPNPMGSLTPKGDGTMGSNPPFVPKVKTNFVKGLG